MHSYTHSLIHSRTHALHQYENVIHKQRNDLPWNIDNDEDDTRFAHVLMYTYSQAYQNMSLLDEVEPSYIILYDPDTQFVREVEVYQARRGKGPGQTLQVYFIVYEESVEEQRYLTALK